MKKTKPFIKWIGGKRQSINKLEGFFPNPNIYRDYYEPFLGGGAIFFHLQPMKAHLNDINSLLIETYRSVKNDKSNLMSFLDQLQSEYRILDLKRKEKYYYTKRDEFNTLGDKEVGKHALLIFLNKTCYGGMYRVNREGFFNVPFGKSNIETFYSKENINMISRLLKNTSLYDGSYEIVLKKARENDFVYLDPPYYPVNNNGFTSYTRNGFLEEEHNELKKVVDGLNERGCMILLSNSNTEFIKELYCDYSVQYIASRRAINSNFSKRGSIQELVILNNKLVDSLEI